MDIHQAMKILNSNFTKVAKDNKDRFELIQKEYSSLDFALRKQIEDVRHKVDIDMGSLEERTLMVIEKAYLKHASGV